MTKDANDDIFTLAYSVVDGEIGDGFVFNLKVSCFHIALWGSMSAPFFFDRHPRIIQAIQLLFPSSHHAYCLWHLVDKFVKQVMRSYPLHNKKHWSAVFKKAAYVPSRQKFEEHINNIVGSMPLARDFIVNSYPPSLANTWFPGNQWGVINNNIAGFLFFT